MSIINDALKKTQSNLQKAAQKDVSETYKKMYEAGKQAQEASVAKTTHAKPKAKTTKTWNKSLLTFVCISLVIAGIFIAILFLLVKESSLVSFKNVLSTFKFENTRALSAPRDPNAIKLDGIIMSQGKYAALINGEIFEVGDIIKGKKIVNITGDKVDLLENGQIKTLKVR